MGSFKRLIVFIFLCLLLIFGSACQMRQKGRKPSPDWSRGLPLGVFVRGDIDLVVEPDGSLVHVVWLTENEQDEALVQYVVMDETAVTQIDTFLDIPATQIRHPRLVLSNGNHVHILWATRAENDRQWDLWYSQLDQAGNFQSEPLRLAASEENVTGYDLVPDGKGGLFVIWQNETEDTLTGAQIGAQGQLLQASSRLASGSSPSIQIDEAGSLHMTWLSENDIFYTKWLDGDLTTAVPTLITSLPESSGRLEGPELGIADKWGYIFWSNYFSSGLEAGTAVAEYTAFPLNNPQRTTPRRIMNAPYEKQFYEPYQGAYNLTQLAQPARAAYSTNFVREPKATTGKDNELAVALTMSQDFRLNEFVQVAVALFKNGKYIGYQMAGKTEAFSQNPVLATDNAGNLYMAWRDGGRGTLAFYALTANAGQDTLNRMEGSDVATVALNGGIEIIAGILFFPLSCVWLLPGFLIIGLYHFWKGESSLNEPVTIVLLIISIVVSQGMKILFLPTITTYVPFSAWLDIPVSWHNALIFIVPMTTIVLGLAFALWMRKRTDSGLAFFFWFTAADGLLTLAIYGVNFLGVF